MNEVAVFLVDDSGSAPFWKHLPGGFWQEVREIAPVFVTPHVSWFLENDFPFTVENVVRYIGNEIEMAGTDGKFDIITDAKFGDNVEAGRQLLNNLSGTPNFRRGCVFSTQTGSAALNRPDCCDVCRISAEPSRLRDEMGEALAFVRDAHRPSRTSPDLVPALSASIHDLHNLPVRLDAETAEEVARMATVKATEFLPDCLAMWEATFGGEPPEIIRVLLEEIRDRKDDAGCQLDEYLARAGSPISFAALVADESRFAQLVKGVRTEFVNTFGEPHQDASGALWAQSIMAAEVPPLLRPVRPADGAGVTALAALAAGLRQVANTLDSGLIKPLREAREQILADRRSAEGQTS
jgi:hypothetical protein